MKEAYDVWQKKPVKHILILQHESETLPNNKIACWLCPLCKQYGWFRTFAFPMISPKDEAWTERDVHKSETALLSFKYDIDLSG